MQIFKVLLLIGVDYGLDLLYEPEAVNCSLLIPAKTDFAAKLAAFLIWVSAGSPACALEPSSIIKVPQVIQQRFFPLQHPPPLRSNTQGGFLYLSLTANMMSAQSPRSARVRQSHHEQNHKLTPHTKTVAVARRTSCHTTLLEYTSC
jgi:hypothetical protein